MANRGENFHDYIGPEISERRLGIKCSLRNRSLNECDGGL
ncbi:hypothetical protein RISK_004797 [Rhodopirellula islandica]|uniref:Uncharacterized protein n=1 Tax=Rhodopirellula islandica TaxID=595434 RepID=A0A0J1B9F3_RHOIS|nr:hypothetical protein RISK_004797 [Rhodopirellula islandica]